MDENTAELVRRSGYSSITTILAAVGALFIGILIVVNVAAQLGWGQPNAQELAASVTEDPPNIVFTNDYRNCGGTTHMGGCFSTGTPDTIYISPSLNYTTMKYIVLHELAHYAQYKNDEKLNDCDADAQAKIWGADISQSGYRDECPANNYDG